MTKAKPASTNVSSIDDHEHAVAQRADELAAIRHEIATAEAELPKIAESDDDEKFEEASLSIERLKRAELRASKRLEAAREAYAEAKVREEQDRRQALYAAAQSACKEAEQLVKGEYRTHAAALAEVLSRLEELYAIINAANADMPAGKCPRDDMIDLDSFRHEPDTPSSTNTEIETYYDEPDDKWRPASWDVRKAALPTARTPKTREKTVYVPGWKGVKMSPLSSGVRLPPAVYGEAAFWPVRDH